MRLRGSNEETARRGGVLAASLFAIGLIAVFSGIQAAQADETTAAQSTSSQPTEVMLAEEAPGEPQYSKDGTAGCMECHDETEEHPVFSIFLTAHAQMGDPRTPLAQQGCESCHGPSAAHADKPRKYSTAVRFAGENPSPAATQNKACIDCHQGGLRMHWQGSQHEASDVPCVACHNVHTTKDEVLVKTTQADTCFECHTQQRAQLFRFSRHPIREGKVICSDCHNPHGSFAPTLLKKATLNETCWECHQEKRGPFLWEHAPVRESCATCHTPHGSSQPRLLKVRGPYLCQQCHLANFHPSTLYEGDSLITGSNASGQTRLLMKNCLNCHVTIHGSNHPSGDRFTR